MNNDEATALRRTRRLLVLGAFLLPVGASILYAFPPTTVSWYPRCIGYVLTGLHCPGCGCTRAAHALLQGNLLLALQCNALFVLLSPFLVWWLGRWARRKWRGEASRAMESQRPIWCLLVVLAIFGIARNVPVYPCTLLAPPLMLPKIE